MTTSQKIKEEMQSDELEQTLEIWGIRNMSREDLETETIRLRAVEKEYLKIAKAN